MSVGIGVANISKVRLAEQGSNPATPASGFGQLYAKADGLYFIGDDGVVEGPILETVDWADYGPSSTVIGWAATPTVNIWYRVIGKIVYVHFRITGTSDATTASFTVPYMTINVVNYKARGVAQIQDNSVVATAPGMVAMEANDNVVNVYTNWNAGAWTASGTKLIQGQLWYERA